MRRPGSAARGSPWMYGCAMGMMGRDTSGDRMREDQIPVAKMIREHGRDPRLVFNPVIFGPPS